jgi:hypothetical protein
LHSHIGTSHVVLGGASLSSDYLIEVDAIAIID